MALAHKHQLKVLAMGHTPPPYHGQAIMQATLMCSKWSTVFMVSTLETRYEQTTTAIGSWKFRKVGLWLKYWVIAGWRMATLRPDLVYAPIAIRAPAFVRDATFVVLARVWRVPYVLHIHGFGLRQLAERGIVWRILVRSVLSGASGIIVLSALLADDVSWCSSRITVIPNALRDEDALLSIERKQVRDALGVSLLMISTLSREKGALVFLEALRTLDKRGLKVQVVLAGEATPEVRYAIEDAVRTFRHIKVRYVGPVLGESKVAAFRDADVLVFPTLLSEAMPLTVLEGMAAGLPVVTTRWRAVSDLIVDGESGLIVPPGASDDLARAIETVCNFSGADRIAMGLSARRIFASHFTMGEFERKFIDATMDAAWSGHR